MARNLNHHRAYRFSGSDSMRCQSLAWWCERSSASRATPAKAMPNRTRRPMWTDDPDGALDAGRRAGVGA